MTLRSPAEMRMALTPGSGPGQAPTLSRGRGNHAQKSDLLVFTLAVLGEGRVRARIHQFFQRGHEGQEGSLSSPDGASGIRGF
jgi:hypothetical protein